MEKKKLYIGFITYSKEAMAYLPYFLDSLFNQNITNFETLAVDGNEDGTDRNIKLLNKYPQIKIISKGKNLGFGKSFNLMINDAQKNGAEYFMVLNPDTILESDCVNNLLTAIKNDNNLASVSPKIYKWNFVPDKSNEKTNIIDSFGIVLKTGLRFFDLGQGQIDHGQYENAKIFGPSGAAAMYRMSALEKVKFNNQYFDELMFMYKEDCDLAYRLFLAGYSSALVTTAKMYHDRTVSGKGDGNILIALNRRNKSRKAKKWSLFHQLIIIKKYWRLQNTINKISILKHVFLMFIFSLIFEQYLLIYFFKIFRTKVNKY
ncbi:MAG: Glycosyl transferase family protein [Candidatus Falkowbacteria bacterium GW2011_GWC2_38_22]|uniref:Glycosyl transferase family protein n=1 Tax=Candidatus Falkowbacteria bacterium GW2011_GWE1_38_31 TaxID=1618638 RepID=A0A0G0JWK4_9BACT|nr:MAG: Glycosyl transferase family protein [Candidatus Falkowbacteria bacterium GW2011_GWF2_38_1205]KKQ62167.1 MAG: Glycosyl transferase family protein [Candidatus Falkowbacteria bacterium GW2011_GWC2_38_22]KKQ64317.1 MAG: Glycosyl transferase family protein [Candidatus Falkowbacteria bacterium GW2011_GWF1_38_22]KKQ66294.1 MAG: Glycosyl transferase family protein [Candidatus Falkowbacteria bacterium GW2011_GWE2_38_254]KKQ71022.1 MAG: Glycosyl transferase family protein [Candidatus Falkowbacter